MIELYDVYTRDWSVAVDFLYDLLAQRKVSESISHKRHPSHAEHEAFVRSKPYLGWYIIADCGDWVGTCYITKHREVGIWLMPSAKGRGAGKGAITLLLAMYPGRVFTNTSLYNDGAKAFYEKMGFRHCANMLEHDNAGCSDNSGKTWIEKVTEEGVIGYRGPAGASLDPKSRESCQEC